MDKKTRQSFLSDLVKINTVGGNEDRVANYLIEKFKDHDVNCKLVPVEKGRNNVLASIGTGNGPKLAFSGHEDTVAIGDENKWEFPPLGAKTKNGKMYGRGTTDMKSGLAAAALAVMELADEGYKLNGTLKFMATVAEESSERNHMQGAETFAKEGYVNDVDAVIIGEPTQSHVVYAHKGSITYKITSKGLAAHSSRPEEGYNAISPLIDYYTLQNEYFETLITENKYLGKTVPVVTKMDGGAQLNSVPDSAELFVKMRTIPEIKNSDIILHLSDMINTINKRDKAKLALVILGDKMPVMTDPNDSFIQLLKSSGEKVLKHDVILEGWSAGTDASELIKGNSSMKVSILGPGNATMHKENEYVDLETFDKFIDLYKEIAKRFLK